MKSNKIPDWVVLTSIVVVSIISFIVAVIPWMYGFLSILWKIFF